MSKEAIEVLVTVPFPETIQHHLRGVSPYLHFTFINAQKTSDVPIEIWAKTEILYTGHVLPPPMQAPQMKWIQFHFAGIDRFVSEPALQSERLLITTLSGAAAPQIAEHALTMILALGRQIPALLNHQQRAEWPKDRVKRFEPFELRGKTVGIIGYGSIGRQLAWLLQPFDVTILATKRDLMNTEDHGYILDGGDRYGDLARRLYPPEALRSMVHECHFVVVTVPLTFKTQNIFVESVFNEMRPDSYLVDISRGGVVNHIDLLNALKSGQIAGAALDVFPEEPLPASSPLWGLSNVIISPHISGASAHYIERAERLFTENLQRYLGSLPLYNLFDPVLGY